MKIGLISYDHPHLKTEQLACRYSDNKRIEEVNIFALPFTPRKERKVIIPHRPDMTKGVPTESLSDLEKVTFRKWDGKQIIGDECDFFVIGGAGILDIEFAKGKPIVNSHPGIIPLTRGLDSLKWAIYNNDPVGITLHVIDAEVDKGHILTIKHTPVFSTDSIETLARRHYELEIEMLANVLDVLKERVSPFDKEKPATRRMNTEKEEIMILKFDAWKEKIMLNRKR
jgi:phosphoribosylglycinamide formyltransferase 1